MSSGSTHCLHGSGDELTSVSPLNTDSGQSEDVHRAGYHGTIIYATETGTSLDAADRIARACRRIRVRVRVVDIAKYPPSDLITEHLVIFVISTTGSGIEPRAMTPLWNMLLRSDLPTDLFDELEFAVFGLGDTSYEKFCWPAKKLSRRLSTLGAREICVRGEGDEQHRLGIDGALDPWINRLQDVLLQLYPLPPGLEIEPEDTLFPPRASLKQADKAASETSYHPFRADPDSHTASVQCNTRITASDWFQDVRHFGFDFKADISYAPGDVAVIHPLAADAEVEAFLGSMGWLDVADEPLEIKHNVDDQSLPDYLPIAVTLRSLFTRSLDFNAVPRLSFFQLLRHFATDELEVEKLNEFCSDEGADELYDYCQRVRRTIREVLEEFRSVEIPRDYLFDLFPPMRPREFSIASSAKKHPKQIHLCIAIVRYKTKLKIPRKGVCTSYLAALRPGATLQIGIKKGFIQLPAGRSTPIICVGPGTGIAPMRAVIEERIQNDSHRNVLYFGCRSATKDQHYFSEWRKYSDDQYLTYRVACSRDGPEGVKRTYVQDLIEADAEMIWKLVGEQDAYVFISGSSNQMPTSVKRAIRHALEKHGGKTEGEAQEFLTTMERTGRLVEECWS